MESIVNDAEIFYIPNYISSEESKNLLKEVNDTNKFRRQKLYFNNVVKNSPKMSYWYGEYPQETQNNSYSDFAYNYNFTPYVQNLKTKIENDFNVIFNSCLVNKYSSPYDKIGFHSDQCEEMGDNPYVASISLGKSRKFLIKNKATNKLIQLILKHGDLLLMRDNSNVNYLHSVCKDAQCNENNFRINLTFRNYNYNIREMNAKFA